MKLKQTLLIGLFLFGLVAVVVPQTAYAASCAGVTTSIITCSQTGVCAGSEDPFEGTEPMSAQEKKDYSTKYGHDYGKCMGGIDPSEDIKQTGVWGILLLAINILTAGIGIAAIGGIVYGSILYTSAGGSAEQTKKAMGIITNVVIGIIAYALMYAFLNFIIPGGLFVS